MISTASATSIPFKDEAPSIRFNGDTLRVDFNRFDIGAYDLFLKVKRLPEYHVDYDRDSATYAISAPSRYAAMLGIPVPAPEVSDLPLSAYLFDDQAAGVNLALAAKRFALWFDTGLGKSAMIWEWARQVAHRTQGRVIIVTLANLISQMMEMRQVWYGDSLPTVRLNSKAEMREWSAQGTINGIPTGAAIAIVNYEKFNPEGVGKEGSTIRELRHLSGIALDESNRLSSGGGKQKWAIIHSSKGIPYKLSCTATPAPDATMEFAHQASFLERMRSEGEIIWTYFTRDAKTHRWTVKKHARKAFFEFMASWSIYVRDPRRYGWRMNMADLPEPVILKHEIEPTPEQRDAAAELSVEKNGQMAFASGDRSTNTIQRAKLSQVAKGFRYVKTAKGRKTIRIPSNKPAAIADIVKDDIAAGLQILVWTIFDAESDIIAAALRAVGITSFDVLTGKVNQSKAGELGPRDEMLERFRTGESRVLISRACMLGFGMNFQHCGSMIFSGWSDSFVAWYQAIRRAVRYGQTKRVRVHIPVITLLEGEMLENIGGKETRNESEIRQMEDNYLAAMRETGILKSNRNSGSEIPLDGLSQRKDRRI